MRTTPLDVSSSMTASTQKNLPLETRLVQNMSIAIPGFIIAAILLFFAFKKLRRIIGFKRNHITRNMRITGIELIRTAIDVSGRKEEFGLPRDRRFGSAKSCPTELTCVDENGKKFIFVWSGTAPDWAKKGNSIDVQYMPNDASHYKLPGQRIKQGYIHLLALGALVAFFSIAFYLSAYAY